MNGAGVRDGVRLWDRVLPGRETRGQHDQGHGWSGTRVRAHSTSVIAAQSTALRWNEGSWATGDWISNPLGTFAPPLS